MSFEPTVYNDSILPQTGYALDLSPSLPARETRNTALINVNKHMPSQQKTSHSVAVLSEADVANNN